MSQDQILDFLRRTYQSMMLNKEQTAKELQISQATIDRLRKDGKLTSKKVGGQVMFRIDEVARFMSV